MTDQLQHKNSAGGNEATLPAEFIAVCVLAFVAGVSATVYFCHSMCCEMEMPGGWTMSMMWMRMPAQTWAASAASFLLMLFLALFTQNALADGALQSLGQDFSYLNALQSSVNNSSDIKAASHPLSLMASKRLVRVDSAARNQYYTDYQWQVWSFSSCSGISMEEVMDAYGRNYIAAEVLQVELNMGVWDTYNGLLGGEPAIAKVANYFGFKADPHPPRTLSDLIYITNKGFPVIVGMPGHILVVRGGDSNFVYLADSAPANRKVLTHEAFLAIWNGFSVLLTPK